MAENLAACVAFLEQMAYCTEHAACCKPFGPGGYRSDQYVRRLWTACHDSGTLAMKKELRMHSAQFARRHCRQSIYCKLRSGDSLRRFGQQTDGKLSGRFHEFVRRDNAVDHAPAVEFFGSIAT